MFVVDVNTFGPAAYFLWFVEFWCTSGHVEGSVLSKETLCRVCCELFLWAVQILVVTLEW